MKATRSILLALSMTVFFGGFGWLALYLCVVLKVWCAVPDVILMLLVVLGLMNLKEWVKCKYDIGPVLYSIMTFLVPFFIWGSSFAIVKYMEETGRLAVTWFAGLPVTLETLSAMICAGLMGVLMLMYVWIVKRSRK